MERARVGKKIEEKAEGRKKAKLDAGESEEKKTKGGKEDKKPARVGRTYRQREPLKAGGGGGASAGQDGADDMAGRRPGTKKELDDVLGRLF